LLCPATAYRCAGKLVHRAVDPVEVVVGELAPPLLDLTAHLLPLACEDILILDVNRLLWFRSHPRRGSKRHAFTAWRMTRAQELTRKSYRVDFPCRRPAREKVAVVAEQLAEA